MSDADHESQEFPDERGYTPRAVGGAYAPPGDGRPTLHYEARGPATPGLGRFGLCLAAAVVMLGGAIGGGYVGHRVVPQRVNYSVIYVVAIPERQSAQDESALDDTLRRFRGPGNTMRGSDATAKILRAYRLDRGESSLALAGRTFVFRSRRPDASVQLGFEDTDYDRARRAAEALANEFRAGLIAAGGPNAFVRVGGSGGSAVGGHQLGVVVGTIIGMGAPGLILWRLARARRIFAGPA